MPHQLPKALSAEDRGVLSEPFANNSITNATARHSAGLRALAWIDAATALLAEQAAQIVVDGMALEMAREERDQAEQALAESRKLHELAEVECGRHRARIAELEAALDRRGLR